MTTYPSATLDVPDETIVESKTAIIIISKGRPAILADTLVSIRQQTSAPEQIIVVVPSQADLPLAGDFAGIDFHIGPIGTSHQRNYGVSCVAPDIDFVAFFDDDIELKSDYLAKGAEFLRQNPAIVGFSGLLLADGKTTREEAKRLIAAHRLKENYRGVFTHRKDDAILHGCNMFIRKGALEYEKFDENLSLYAFGEDYDLSMRLRRYGLIGRFKECLAVHLQSPSGRVDELKRGYAIVANNWYFIKKGVSHLPFPLALLRFWHAVVLKLMSHALWLALKRDKSQDWWGCAKGFILGATDVLLGRSSPQKVLTLMRAEKTGPS